MVETTMSSPGGYTVVNIQLDPTRARGEGGPEYPRLVLPIGLTLTPERGPTGEKFFFLLRVRHSLHATGRAHKIADAIDNFSPLKAHYANYKSGCDLEFPLDAARLRLLEETRRGGDLAVVVRLRYDLGFCDDLVVQKGDKKETLRVVTDVYSPSAEVRVDIPHSHWISNVLPGLGQPEYFLLEIPKGDRVLEDAWRYLDQAENSYRNWNTKGAYANCRELGTLLNRTVGEKFGKGDFRSEKWGRAYASFERLASLDLHLEDIKKSENMSPAEVKVFRSDVEHLLFRTRCLLKYGQELLAE